MPREVIESRWPVCFPLRPRIFSRSIIVAVQILWMTSNETNHISYLTPKSTAEDHAVARLTSAALGHLVKVGLLYAREGSDDRTCRVARFGGVSSLQGDHGIILTLRELWGDLFRG